jgi:hypothetical protein
VEAHGVQTYYAGLVARAAGMQVTLSINGDEVTVRACSVSDCRLPAFDQLFSST